MCTVPPKKKVLLWEVNCGCGFTNLALRGILLAVRNFAISTSEVLLLHT